jgi:intracellular multiplication protein IcmJ
MKLQMLPLVLSVKAKNWRMNDPNSAAADAEFSNVRKKALDRDDKTCRFCGFKAQQWQEVHHLNDDHSDNRPDNLVTACSFCHMCQHIGLAGRNDEAVLVWLPEMSQIRLNHLVRTLLVAVRWSEGQMVATRGPSPNAMMAKSINDGARALLAKLRSRQAECEEYLKTSDPAEVADLLLAMPDEHYAKRGDFLRGIRLLPLGTRRQDGEDIMPKVVDSWLGSGGPYAGMQPASWVGVLKSAIG